MVKYRDNLSMPEVLEPFVNLMGEEERDQFHTTLCKLYDDIQKYMTEWTRWTEPLANCTWVNLDESLDFDKVICLTNIYQEMKVEVDQDALQLEVTRANQIINAQSKEWKEKGFSTSEKWVDLLKRAPDMEELGKIADALLALPSSNATCERLFSEMVYFWDKWKGSMEVATVKSILSIRYNFERDCDKVLSMLIADQSLRDRIRGNEKYGLSKLEQDKALTGIVRKQPEDSSEDDLWDQWEAEEAEDFYDEFHSVVKNPRKKSKLFDSDDDGEYEEENNSELVTDTSENSASAINYSEIDSIRDEAIEHDMEIEPESYPTGEHDYVPRTGPRLRRRNSF